MNPIYDKNPEDRPWVSEQAYDASSGTIRYAVDGKARTLIIDFCDAQTGSPSGTLLVYLGENIGSLPWAVIKAGQMLQRPISIGDRGTYLTIVPNGATGLIHVTLTEEALPAGRYGPFKSGGSGGSGFLFIQAAPASTWTVAHNLGYLPSVTVIDSANNIVYGNVHYVDLNNLTITFSAAFSGEAYMI